MSFVSTLFNSIAGRYDAINRVLSFGLDMRWRRALRKFLPPQQNLHLLDVATGTGDQLLALLADPRITSAIGVDIARDMLERGRLKLVPWSGRVRLQEGDALSLAFAAHTFDVITISFGIRNVPNPLLALREMRRVLKPNGRVLILEFSMPTGWRLPFFRLYLRHILPRIGGLLSGNPNAYRYLNRTIESFPSGNAFLAWMREAGFTHTTAHLLTGGAVTLYVGSP